MLDIKTLTLTDEERHGFIEGLGANFTNVALWVARAQLSKALFGIQEWLERHGAVATASLSFSGPFYLSEDIQELRDQLRAERDQERQDAESTE